MIFIDTLRQDALSMYGYDRPTKLDEWAKTATIFDQARTLHWTLPSAKSLLTGSLPNHAKHKKTLQALLGERGWATGFIAGNVYLSSAFQMEQDWGTHRCVNWPSADYQIKQAERFLSKHNDRPAMLLLHLMDMHLPYTEPANYRSIFAGSKPNVRIKIILTTSRPSGSQRKTSSGSQTVCSRRYDNNLRYLDDACPPFSSLNPDDRVVIFSDHGEEFGITMALSTMPFSMNIQSSLIIKSSDLPPDAFKPLLTHWISHLPWHTALIFARRTWHATGS